MLEKTRGIVLNFIKYKETSIIARVFTEKLGLQSYIVNSVRSKKSNKIALFQPLTLLDLVVYHNNKRSLHRIQEIKCSYAYESIPLNIKKSAVLIFLSEILGKVIKEGSEAEKLFEFLFNSLIILDKMEGNVENFHLTFLIKLSGFMGFSAESPQQILAEVQSFEPRLHESEHRDFVTIFNTELGTSVKISNTSRRLILNLLIQFYQGNFEGFSDVKSIKILKEILN